MPKLLHLILFFILAAVASFVELRWEWAQQGPVDLSGAVLIVGLLSLPEHLRFTLALGIGLLTIGYAPHLFSSGMLVCISVLFIFERTLFSGTTPAIPLCGLTIWSAHLLLILMPWMIDSVGSGVPFSWTQIFEQHLPVASWSTLFTLLILVLTGRFKFRNHSLTLVLPGNDGHY